MIDYRRFALALTVLLLSACASLSPAPVVDRAGASRGEGSAKEFYTVKKGDTLYSIARDHGIDYRELVVMNRIENPGQIRVGQQLRVAPPAASRAEGGAVVAQPIGSSSGIEQRSLDSSVPPAQSVSSVPQFKTEPKAGKVPYSEEALAQAQRGSEPAPVVAVAPAEIKPEAKPDSKPAGPAEASSGPDDVGWIWPANGKLLSQFSEAGSKGIDIGGRAGDPVVAAGEGKVVYSGTGLRGYGKLIIVKHNATFLSAYAHNQNLLVKEGQSVSKGQKIAEMGNTDADQVKLHFEVRRQGKPVDPLKYLPQR
ncbi:MAG: peptidoglycan DD-metalloendopeptidase family protein [Zoogloeaceae bacterium]|nr:peptidoglycan DD-metalloendopeptidase family protein [Zoogloeaceae bacterium]